MNNKILYILVVIALTLGILGIILPKPIIQTIDNLGGSIHNTIESFDEGVAVDGKIVITGDGSFFTKGNVYAFGESASTSITAEMLCPGADNKAYNLFTIEPFEPSGGDDVSASISFSDDEAFAAVNDCIDEQGDSLTFTIDPTASTSTAYIDPVTTGLVYGYASTQQSDWDGGQLMIVTVRNVNGTSLSWEFDSLEASISFQP